MSAPQHEPEFAAMAARTAVVLRDDRLTGEELMASFVEELLAQGVRVGGVYQRTIRPDAERKRMVVIDASTGAEFSISLDEGPKLESCVVDDSALAEASMVLRKAIAAKVELLVVNKFSKQESLGRGLGPDMFEAMTQGIPVLTSLHERYLEPWRDLSGGVGTLLACDMESLRAWWRAVSPVHSAQGTTDDQ